MIVPQPMRARGDGMKNVQMVVMEMESRSGILYFALLTEQISIGVKLTNRYLRMFFVGEMSSSDL